MAAGTEPTIQRLGGITELRRGHVVDRRAELRVIEDVEKIGADLQREALAELEHSLKVNPRYAESV